MTILQEIRQRIVSSTEYDRMIRTVAPMCDYFNVNQFYYLRMHANNSKGYFSTIGTHVEWGEFLCENIERLIPFPELRYPDQLISRVTLLKKTTCPKFKSIQDLAWNKYRINFTINIQVKIPGGIESYGFGVKSLHPKSEEHMLNELPLLKKFISYFQKENKKFIDFVHDHEVDISSFLGPSCNQAPNAFPISPKRELLLKQLGLGAILLLTPREIEVLKYMAYGFPANYIAQKLHLSCRTVENYITVIKSKLDCDSKVELIKKAQDIVLVINPSETCIL